MRRPTIAPLDRGRTSHKLRGDKLGLAVGIAATVLAQASSAWAIEPTNDPFERANRANFGFSMFVDKVLLRPVNWVYQHTTTSGLRRRVGNVVANLGEPSTAINDVLQGRGAAASQSVGRFAINSTFGVAGVFDVAAHAGLTRHTSDFGQTLSRYGAGPGAYVYIPVLGPSNLRDSVGRIVDVAADPVSLAAGGYRTRFGATRLGVTAIDTRSALDPALRALGDAADPYAFARAAYVQSRQAAIGQPASPSDLPDFDAPPQDPTPAKDPQP